MQDRPFFTSAIGVVSIQTALVALGPLGAIWGLVTLGNLPRARKIK